MMRSSKILALEKIINLSFIMTTKKCEKLEHKE